MEQSTSARADPPDLPPQAGHGSPGFRRPSAAAPAAGDPSTDDACLIARSLSDPYSFEQIFLRHAGEIHRYAARRLGELRAEDVVGEVFLIAFRRRAAYDLSYLDARPWLYGIATNVIRRHRHSEERYYRALARTGVDPALAPPADEVVARVAATSQRRALAAALDRLRPADRDTLLLYVWGDLSYEQTAQALSIPVGTVRSRLNRVRARLRDALRGVGDADEGLAARAGQ